MNILDYNGGDADTLYAVNRCHELVDNCGERHASVDDDALSEAKRSKRHTRVARKGKATRQKKENGSRQLKWAYAQIAQGRCRICGKPRNKYKYLCDGCEAKASLYVKLRRQRLKEEK